MTMATLRARLQALSPVLLQGIRRGIEKESLRALPDGSLALTPHPAALGSPLTHSSVTTDFSESQLELITGVHADVDGCYAELTQIHQFVCRAIADEYLWAGSMPCKLPPDENIPIAVYGSSNVGLAKTVYRTGLGYRYGRRMQMISGIHYNWSMPGLNTEDYFGLIRNFRRHSFLLLYLFGASPAVCASFVTGREHELQPLARHTLQTPYGTSLRMGRLGYQSDAQAALAVSCNSLEQYAAQLQVALTLPYPAYEKIGIRGPQGDYRQLATSVLQIENEFYSTIRPKRVILPGERSLHALRRRGVEYVEVRCMDLDPFLPVGIDTQTMRFIDLLLLYCLLGDSPPDTPQEIAALRRNQHLVADRGRDPALRLDRSGQEVTLAEWGAEIVEACAEIAVVLDALHGGSGHRAAIDSAFAALQDSAVLPSARVLATMAHDHDNSYVDFIRAQSELAKGMLLGLPFAEDREAAFRELAQQSRQAQKRMEAADTVPFERYRESYLTEYSLGG